MQNYSNDKKNLFYALQDLLFTIQQQPKGTIKDRPNGTDFMQSEDYKNAVETHQYYLDKLS